MNDDLTKREQLSALADGELSACIAFRIGQQEWRMYHLVGDVLRSPELAHHSRHDVLSGIRAQLANEPRRPLVSVATEELAQIAHPAQDRDRKSTRLNSSHSQISYAVFCLKKKK